MNTITTFEEHGEVLPFWQGTIKEPATLLYFDRHLDLKLISETKIQKIHQRVEKNQSLNILNRDIPCREDEQYAYGLDDFLYAAIDLNMFKKIIWVSPVVEHKGNVNDLGQVFWNLLSLIPQHGTEIIDSFKKYSFGIETKIKNTTLMITTLNNLKYMQLYKESNLITDIDLDFFYNPENKNLYYKLDQVLQILKENKITDTIKTMTYSIKSGFMPEPYRRLSSIFSHKLDMKLISNPARNHLVPIETMAALSNRKPIDQKYLNYLQEKELDILSGIGWKLRSLLLVQMGQLGEAEKCYYQAKEHGDEAFWAAYNIGMSYMKQKDYEHALKWFQQKKGVVDTIQAHSLILQILCHLHLENFEYGLSLAHRTLELLPMRTEIYELIEIFCKKMKMKEKDYIHYKENYQKINQLLKT
ncbi:hypothetical protein OCF10_26010 [Bacillus cereus]|uniref:hypothetical protein n=1 Tax=Bacillus TaxID=1386 RepID=UPI00283A8F9C|nr:hypothetical protein [Bacillus cereus]MCU4992343.1 hypothetical protein [Bacillus cereus]